MNNFFRKNIAALLPHSPSAGRLTGRLPDKVEVQNTPSGDVTVKYGGVLIHSSYDPVKEGREFARQAPSSRAVFLYGYGLGYHIPPLLEKIGPDGFLVAIELNPDLLASAMVLRDQTAVLSHKRLRVVFGEDETQVAAEIAECMSLLRQVSGGSVPEVLYHAPSLKCIPGGFERIANALEILQMERRTPAVFGGLEGRNYDLNQDLVLDSPGVKTLRGAHKNQPAILASAGPSLDDALPYLRATAGHCVLACVDTALPILTRHGFLPHYVFSLDPQDESFAHFRDDLDCSARLIYLPTANARAVRSYQGERFVVFKEDHSLFKSHEALMAEKGTTRAGGSVSCLGLDCLIQMGCDPIFLIGQDCAFSGNRIYSRHAPVNEHFLDSADRATLGRQHAGKTMEKKRVAAAGHGGGSVLTNQMMYSYMRYIEEIAAAHPESRIYNLCSHGARIENVEPLGSIRELTKTLLV
ncbi:MAG: motility associated factor glycosyltransferase family protein [Nitrospinae bacterium]|nr:motility associated factor glycosyltransferase family protein [Nitrospinota bacterium]